MFRKKISRGVASREFITVLVGLVAFGALTGLWISSVPTADASVAIGNSSPVTLSKGLVAYWPLDGNTTNWMTDQTNDISGNGNTGQLILMSTTTSPVAGKIGGALKFAGSGYITTGYTIPTQTSATSFTWSVWVNVGVGNSGTDVILGFRTGSSWVKLTPSSLEYTGVLISYAIPTGLWKHIVIVKNGSNFTYYVNGVAIGTASNATSVATNTFYIGYDPGFPSDGAFIGSLDDVRVYNRALSPQEVAQLYALGGGTHLNDTSIIMPAVNLKTGLAGYWPLEEGIGSTTKDLSGNGIVGTLQNNTSWITGKYGKALSFNGSTNYVDLPMTVAPATFTASAWFKATTLTPNNARIVSNSHTDSDDKGFQLMFNSGGASGFFDIGNGTTECRATWNKQLVTGTWYHYVGVYDGSRTYAYINGALATTSIACAGGSLAASGNDVNIGRDPAYAGDYFPGTIDDVRLYNRSLSAAEVKQLYLDQSVDVAHSNTTSVASSLVGYWTFDGSKTNWNIGTTQDSSGRGNTGQLILMSTSSSPVPGKIGGALKFNGSTQYVNVPNASVFNPTTPNFTVSAWVKKALSAGTGGIVNKDGVFAFAIGVTPCTANQIKLTKYTVIDICIGTFPSDTKYHYLSAVWSSTGISLYIDGMLNATSANTSNFATASTPLTIGYDNADSAYFNGSVDDVRVYNRALSAQELGQLYLTGK